MTPLSNRDLVALTIYGEGRGEPVEGRIAIACVIRNRVLHDAGHIKPQWWGDGYEGVCLKPFQFSCWNAADPNRVVLQDLSTKLLRGEPIPSPVFEECQWIGDGCVSNRMLDKTLGATHYYARSISPPKWVTGATFQLQVGNHLFYKNVV